MIKFLLFILGIIFGLLIGILIGKEKRQRIEYSLNSLKKDYMKLYKKSINNNKLSK